MKVYVEGSIFEEVDKSLLNSQSNMQALFTPE
jgi:hypothetical protein